MRWLIVGLAVSGALSACAAPAHPVVQAPAEGSLSDGASKIVAALRLRPDIGSLCGGGEGFRSAMRDAVMRLVMSGEIEGNPRHDAESAADFLHAHCGQSEAASVNAVGPSASPAAR